MSMNKKKLVEDNINLVYYLINKHYPTFLQNEDVVQEGMLGLCLAADTYDESKSKFSTFASWCILNQIRYYFRENQKHSGVLSYDKETEAPDGGVTSFIELATGDMDIDESTILFHLFCETLTDEERELVDLLIRYDDNEVSSILGLSPITIYPKKRRLLKKWRKFYGND